jgi:hypothetical protein
VPKVHCLIGVIGTLQGVHVLLGVSEIASVVDSFLSTLLPLFMETVAAVRADLSFPAEHVCGGCYVDSSFF